MKALNTNLKKRVIPIILVSSHQVVKSREFKDYRVFGNLEQTINVFNQRNVDEIIVLDIDAQKKKSKINLEILKTLSRNTIMPFSYGGGIQTIDDVKQCLNFGCDKVVINSKFIENINFVSETAKVFGSQCIIASVDYNILNKNDFQIFSHSKLKTDNLNIKRYINNLGRLGVGEIIITSVNHEGNLKGYDHSLLQSILNEVDIPILINGGCGKPEDMIQPLLLGAEGVCASSIFFYTQYAYRDIKNILLKNKIKVRIT